MTVPCSGAFFGLLVAWPLVSQTAHAQLQGQPPALRNPLEAQALELLTGTRDRPLFTPGRRRSADPPPPVLAQTPGEPTPPPNLVLAGVVVDQDGARAIVRDSEANQTMSLRTGDTVKEWRVEHIEPRRLVLVLGDRSTEFSLFRGDAAAAPSGSVPASSALQTKRNSIRDLLAADR